MLFHLTTDDHIGIINEQGPAEAHSDGTTFASEQHFHELAKEWPMKRLVEIWNRLPGVEAVARFTDRKTAIARIWKAVQSLNGGSPAEPAAAAPKLPKKAKRAPKPKADQASQDQVRQGGA